MAEISFSKGELISQGWKATKSNYVLLLKIILVYIGLSIITAVLGTPLKNQALLLFVVNIVSTVIQTVLEIGFIKIGLDIVDGKTPDFKDLYSNYSRFLDFFLTSLIVGIIIVVGFILLIVPGIYLAIKYQFTPYIVVDKKLAFAKAWGASAQLVKGRWMPIFLFDLTLIGLNILGAVALGIGLLITIPTSYFATLYLYRKLS